jgi:hypothetical protein
VVSVDSLGVPVVKVWDDINKPDPTHTISMNGSQHHMSLEWAQTEIQNLLDRVALNHQEAIFDRALRDWVQGCMADYEYLIGRREGGGMFAAFNAAELRELRPFLANLVNRFFSEASVFSEIVEKTK